MLTFFILNKCQEAKGSSIPFTFWIHASEAQHKEEQTDGIQIYTRRNDLLLAESDSIES